MAGLLAFALSLCASIISLGRQQAYEGWVDLNADNNHRVRVLAVGDVIGRPGRRFLKKALPILKERLSFDALVVNVENSAGGFGLTPEVYREFIAMDIHSMTSGNHIYDKKGYADWFPDASRLVRPLNFPPNSPGQGYQVVDLPGGQKLVVLNLIGRVFMKSYDCPFRAADEILPKLREISPMIVVDFHGEATSEKMALGWRLAGKASFVWGTHTHCPTADGRILNHFTGYQSDLGMTGPYDSVIGMAKEPVIKGFLTLERSPFTVAKHDVRLGACVFDLDPNTGKCLALKSLFLSEEELSSVQPPEN